MFMCWRIFVGKDPLLEKKNIFLSYIAISVFSTLTQKGNIIVLRSNNQYE